MLPFGLDKPEPVTGPLFAMLFDCGREVSHSAPMIRIAHEDQFLRPESFLPLKAKSKFELTEHQQACADKGITDCGLCQGDTRLRILKFHRPCRARRQVERV